METSNAERRTSNVEPGRSERIDLAAASLWDVVTATFNIWDSKMSTWIAEDKLSSSPLLVAARELDAAAREVCGTHAGPELIATHIEAAVRAKQQGPAISERVEVGP